MARTSRYFSILLQIILLANSARSNDESIQLDSNTVKTFYSLKQNFNLSNIISEISHIHSTDNDDCFNDLSAITNGLGNLNEWAFKSGWIFLG